MARSICRICGKEYESYRAGGVICSLHCKKISINESQKRRRDKEQNQPSSFSLEICPFGAGLIKADNWHYDELKPCEV